MSTLRSSAHPEPLSPVRLVKHTAPPREYSLAHLTMLSLSPPELVAVAACAGYSYVGLRLMPFGLPGEPQHRLDDNPALLRRTRAALHRYGIGVLDIELARICDDHEVDAYRPALMLGAELGARHVLTSVWTEDRERARAQLLRLWNIARPLGLSIDLESVPFSNVRNLAEAIELLQTTGVPGGLCVDTMHFAFAGCRLEELASVPRSWLRYAQISDGPAYSGKRDMDLRYIAREARQFLGEGSIDVGCILRSLPAIPYSIELPNTRWLAQLGTEQFARRCLTSAEGYLAAYAAAHSLLSPPPPS